MFSCSWAKAMQVFAAMPQQNHLGNDGSHAMRKQYFDVALGSERKGEMRIGRNTMWCWFTLIRFNNGWDGLAGEWNT